MTDTNLPVSNDRHDLGTHGRELILNARNIAVDFKVEGGIVHAVRDVSSTPGPHLLVADLEQVGAVEEHLAAHLGVGAAVEAEDRGAGDRLAGPGLPDDAERLAALELVGEALGGLDNAVHRREVHDEVAHRQVAVRGAG
jgi:hypothetical protein